jgi:hypothetical protein
MGRLDRKLRAVFGAVIQRVSNLHKVLIEGDLNPHGNVTLLCDLNRFLRTLQNPAPYTK